MKKDSTIILTIIFTTGIITCRIIQFIASPLWLDSMNPKENGTEECNASESNHSNIIEKTNPFFLVFIQCFIPFSLFAICLLGILLFKPSYVTEVERNYPKRQFFTTGFAQAVSCVLVAFSMSGQRTAPYLQALLGNFNIPIQFTLRFIIIRRFPTCRKFICTLLVMAAEIVCLLPSIFPYLESAQQHRQDGGATGAGRILWPLCFVSSMVPYAVANVLMETSLNKRKTNAAVKVGQLNMVYYMFWYTLALSLGIASMFWADFIPGFGTSHSFKEFGEMFWFNLLCLFGQRSCVPGIFLLAWALIFVNLFGYLTIAYVLRYSEGANFMMVAMSLRSPVLFLFWTLFSEHPFYWHPHTSLSTWLSIGALCVMVPAVLIYNTGGPERSITLITLKKETKIEEDKDSLIPNGTHDIQ